MLDQFDRILSVEQFNSLIKEVLSNIGRFKVKGEITEFKITQNKGLYITLSDGKANLKVKGYAPTVRGVDLVEKGMNVVVHGKAELYVPYGSFSLSATSIEPVGEGALAIAYEKLKDKLEKEGLFASEHKQALPKFIRKVALLTGKDSAAYSDFIKILKEHESGVEVDYYPVLVQGDKSPGSLKKALSDARNSDVDLIVITRGGGSLEDLKSFNDEQLAREIFSSPKLIVAGVGHENDESIADFVADVRASTPSQAAYYIARQNEEFIQSVEDFGLEIHDLLSEKIVTKTQELQNITFTIEVLVDKMIKEIKTKLKTIQTVLNSYNIKNVLKRGFAVLQKGNKKIVSIDEVEVGDEVKTTLKDGSFDSKVKKLIKLK